MRRGTLQLHVFAPFDLGRSFVTPAERRAFDAALLDQGWTGRDPDEALELDPAFVRLHRWYSRPVPAEPAELAPGEEVDGPTELHSVEVVLSCTGIALVTAVYDLGPSTELDVALHAYQVLSRGHFQSAYAQVAALLAALVAELPDRDRPRLRRPTSDPAARPHWTHGVFSHLHEEEDPLGPDELANLSQAEPYQEHYAAGELVRGSFGWETTAVSTSSEAERARLVDLVRLLGYLWELLYVVDGTAGAYAETLQDAPEDVRQELPRIREVRTMVTTLVDVCALTRLSMTDRYVRIIEVVLDEWHTRELKEAVGAKLHLLDLLYGQLKDEDSEARNERFNLLILVLTLVSVVGVAAEAISYVGQGWPAEPSLRAVFLVGLPLGIALGLLLVTRRAGGGTGRSRTPWDSTR